MPDVLPVDDPSAYGEPAAAIALGDDVANARDFGVALGATTIDCSD